MGFIGKQMSLMSLNLQENEKEKNKIYIYIYVPLVWIVFHSMRQRSRPTHRSDSPILKEKKNSHSQPKIKLGKLHASPRVCNC
jgi:hypothetical protein